MIKHSSICAVACLAFMLASAFMSPAQNGKSDPNQGIKKYNTFMQVVKFAYVDTVNEAKLVDKAILETLKELDPHSVYIPKKEVRRANEPLEGNFDGVGIQFEILRDTINVVHPVPGGPSEKLGIMSGDKIIKIDGEVVIGKKITTQFVLDHLRGKRGTKVNVSIYRKGKKDLMEYTITRDKIPINSIDASYLMEPGIGYINLNRFSQSSMQEFQEAVGRLQAMGMHSLILDLRNNSGGYMGTAIELSDEFLPYGKLIVFTKGSKSPREDYYATSKGLMEKGKIVIMINENSASASEIVSGAIQDWDRGIIVGRRSFGKGLVQRPFQLPDSSQIRLTTARYYNPSGKCIQKPYEDGIDKYYQDFSDRMRHGEFIHPDSIKFPDSLRYYTSKKRVVYGGGGIMPDVFIPWDSTLVSDYYLDLRRKNLITLFASDYVDRERTKLQKQYPDFNTFDKGFLTDEQFMKGFFKFAEKDSLRFDEAGYNASGKLIQAQLKGLIAQKLWDLTALYAIINQTDEEVQKALEVIRDEQLFDQLQIDR